MAKLENVLEVIDELKTDNLANVQALKKSLLDINVKLEEMTDGENLMFVRNSLADFKETLDKKFQKVLADIAQMQELAQNDEKATEHLDLMNERMQTLFNLFDAGLKTLADKLENLEDGLAKSVEDGIEETKFEFKKLSDELKLHQHELLETSNDNLETTAERFSFLAESIKMFCENLKVQTDMYKEFVSEKTIEINEFIKENETALKDDNAEIKSALSERFVEIDQKNKDFSATLEMIKEQISEAIDNIDEIPQKTSENLAKEFKLISDAGNETLAEIKIIQDYSQNLIKSVNKIVEFTDENTNAGIVEAIKELDIDEHITNLFEKIDVFNNNFNIKTEFLEDQIREMKTMFADISIDIQNKEAELLQKESERVQEYFNKIDDVSTTIVNLEESLKISGVEYKEHVTTLNRELTEFIAEFNTIYNEIAGSTQVEINNSLDELKQFITVNSTNYSDRLIIIQEQFSQAFKDLYEVLRTNNFELIEKGLHADDLHDMGEAQLKLLENIKEKIEKIDTNSLDAKLEKITTQNIENRNSIGNISGKVEKISAQNLENIAVLSDLDKKVEKFINKDFNVVPEEQKLANNNIISLSKEVLSNTQELNSKMDVLATTDYTDNFEELTDEVLENRDMLANLDAKIDNLPKPIDYSDDFDEIWEQNIDNRKLLDELNAKLDIFVSTEDTELLADELEEIKEIIKSSNLANETNLSENLISRIEAISKTLNEHEETTAKIKEDLVNTFVSVFSNSNFVEETEEIKDFVEERTDELSRQLVDVKSQIENMKGADIEDYSYTLSDVENDIAKLRQEINDMSFNTSSGELNQISRNIYNLTSSIDSISKNLTHAEIYQLKTGILKLNEDILSISSRTNKLLMNSDEAQKTLAEGLTGFAHIAYNLEERMVELSNKEFNEELIQKLEKMLMLLENGANSDATVHKVLMYLGEWVDASSKTFESLENKTEEISEISDAISELRKSLPEKVALIDFLEERFEEQQSRIDRLEIKMDELADIVKASYNPAQVQKLEKIEGMLASLSTNVEKLTSYVD